MTGPEHLEALARSETGDRAAHLRAWARYLAREDGPQEHLAALERLRGTGAGAAETLRGLGTVWGDEPWVYGDWAARAPAPERDGLPQWRVDLSVLTRDELAWPPPWEHPQVEPIAHYGWDDGDEGFQRYDVTPFIWAAAEAEAARLADEWLGAQLAGHYVVARRLRCTRVEGVLEDKPRGPEDLEDSVAPVPWLLAESDGRRLRVLYDGRGEFERVEAAESGATVTVTVHERFGPHFTPDGFEIGIAAIGFGPTPRAARVDLAAPAGDRAIIDGATGRRPDQLGLWDRRWLEERERLLAVIRSSRRPPREYAT